MDSVCAERLAAMDATTTELRTRAGTLARREAERAELLERAEAAWKDLELGYRRRLTLAEEKEEDISKQVSILEARCGVVPQLMVMIADVIGLVLVLISTTSLSKKKKHLEEIMKISLVGTRLASYHLKV